MSATVVEVQSPLQTGFSFWYMRRGKGAAATNIDLASTTESTSATGEANASIAANSVHPYENALKCIATVQSVEDFWSVYDHMVRPNKMTHQVTTTFHFFREGVKPTWEDPMNSRGGSWSVRLRKGLASRYWEELLLALIGSQFSSVPDGEVCGVVINIRHNEDILSVWNKTASDPEITDRVRETIKRILQLPNFIHMEYKPHETSLLHGDKSSTVSSATVATTAGTGSFRGTTAHSSVNRSSVGTTTNNSSGAGDREGGASTYARPSNKRDSERSWR